MNQTIRDLIIGTTVIVVGAAVIAFASIPTRVSVLEAKFASFDNKLDTIIDLVKQQNVP